MNQLTPRKQYERETLKPLMHAILHPYRPVYGGDGEIVEYVIHEHGKKESIEFLKDLCARLVRQVSMTDTPLLGDDSQSNLRNKAVLLVKEQIQKQARLPKTVSPDRKHTNTACCEATLVSLTIYACRTNLLQEYLTGGWNEILSIILHK